MHLGMSAALCTKHYPCEYVLCHSVLLRPLLRNNWRPDMSWNLNTDQDGAVPL